MKRYSITMTEDGNINLLRHLLRSDDQEDLCFATFLPSEGSSRYTGIIRQIILPQEGERRLHGNVSFSPEYLERALMIAGQHNEGLVFLHSHLGPGWQGMSPDDVAAELRIAPGAFAITRYPLVGMTAGTDGAWSARFWEKDVNQRRKYERLWSESVRVTGRKLSITFNESLISERIDIERQVRTISAWGPKTQQDISRLRIGIVGLGSVGSIVAEILARTGITRFVLIDFDTVEDKNLDRLTNVFAKDVGRSKVLAIKEAIQRSSPSTEVDIDMVEYSVCEKEGYLAALDCDILFSCVDRPWPRQVLNYIAYAHLIPVIDGGILVRTNAGNIKIKGADWKAHIVGIYHECLECIGQYKSENAKLEREGFIDDPSYMKDWAGPPIDVHENVYPFSSHLASSLVLQMLSFFIAPSGISDIGQQMYHFVTGQMDVKNGGVCHPSCFFNSVIAKADQAGLQVFGIHRAAQQKRAKRMLGCSNSV